MSEKPLNLDTSENQVIDLFVKSWRAKSSDECSYPFTEQNNWTGTAVMEFMLFTLREVKQRIRKACEFYLKYKDEPKLLKKEFPEQLKADKKKFGAEDILDNFLTVINDKITSFDGFGIETYKRKYNEWLFKLAFRGVFKEVKEK